jgi:uncharacterized membrane protein (UPF0127 family)
VKKFWFQVIALIAIIFAGFWVTVNHTQVGNVVPGEGLNSSSSPNSSGSNLMKTITINSANGQVKAALNVEIADTDQARALGLGNRSSLGANSGMLFLFPTAKIPQFWMKGMKFPLDMIWINGDTIIGFEQKIPQPTGTSGETLPIYSPTQPVDKVLEVNSGFVQAHGIVAGDKLQQVQ